MPSPRRRREAKAAHKKALANTTEAPEEITGVVESVVEEVKKVAKKAKKGLKKKLNKLLGRDKE